MMIEEGEGGEAAAANFTLMEIFIVEPSKHHHRSSHTLLT